jgi:3-hydroxyisobutyrate dehydrogenase-like beta-hydroxyacid dehydrogenase
MPAEVGFIGLGIMGSALSGHLLKAGIGVVGCDLDERRRSEHLARGGVIASTPAAVAGRVDLVVTSLPGPDAFDEVVCGDQGLAAAGGSGLVVVDTSTLSLETKGAAARFLAERGATLLDCPLSGTGEQARRGDVIAFLSGDGAAKARALGVVEAMTRKVYDAGGFGNGSRLKFVANLLVAVHNLAAAEALLLARRAGLDLDLVLRAVGDGAGGSRMLQVRGPLMVAGDYSDPSVRVEVFSKDIDIIAEFARGLRSPTPLFALTSVFYQAALAQGRAGQDSACVMAVLEELAGGRGGGAGRDGDQ